jgi:hypothetical protein
VVRLLLEKGADIHAEGQVSAVRDVHVVSLFVTDLLLFFLRVDSSESRMGTRLSMRHL